MDWTGLKNNLSGNTSDPSNIDWASLRNNLYIEPKPKLPIPTKQTGFFGTILNTLNKVPRTVLEPERKDLLNAQYRTYQPSTLKISTPKPTQLAQAPQQSEESKFFQNILNKTTKPIQYVLGKPLESTQKLFKQKTGISLQNAFQNKLKDFFTPTENVRVRDVLRELPETEKSFITTGIKGAPGFIIGMLRAIPRSAASLGLPAEPGQTTQLETSEFGIVGQAILGKEPIKDIRTSGTETLKSFGVSDEIAQKFGMPTGLIFAGLDVVPMIGGEKNIIKEIAFSTDVKRIAKLLPKIIKADKGDIKILSETLKNVRTVEEVEKTIKETSIAISTRNLIKEIPDNVNPIITKDTVNELKKQILIRESKDAKVALKNIDNIDQPIKNWSELENKLNTGIKDIKIKNDIKNHIDSHKLYSLDDVYQKQATERLVKEYPELFKVDETTKPISEMPASEAKASGQSFDEWMKGQGRPTYHGSPNASKIEQNGFKLGNAENLVNAYGRGVYLTENKKLAGAYSGLPEKGGKVLETYIPKDIKLYKATEKQAYTLRNDELIEKGYDGIETTTAGGNRNITIFDPAVVKTRSQLKAEWNSADKVVKPRKGATSKEIEMGITPAPNKVTLQKNEMTLLKDRIRTLARGSRIGAKEAKDNIKNIQTDLIRYIKDNLPTSERGQFISLIKNTTIPKKLDVASDRISNTIKDFNEVNRLLKLAGNKKEKIAFIKNQYELNQSVANEIKKEVGITNWQKATPKQLDEMLVKLKQRSIFKVKAGYKLVDKDAKIIVDPKIYEQAIPEKSIIIPDVEKLKSTGHKTVQQIDEKIGILSTRIKNISPELASRFRRREFDTGTKIIERSKIVEPLLKKAKKINKQDRAVLKLAQLNGDVNKVQEIFSKYNLIKEGKNTRSVLDNLFKEGNDVGMEMGHNPEYWTRRIKDPKGLVKYFYGTEERPIIEQAFQQFKIKWGRDPKIEERANIINKMMRGYQGGGGISLSLPGAAKARKIDIIDNELAKFYDDPMKALPGYIEMMTDQIETRKLFGKHKIQIDGLLNIDQTIGSYVDDLLIKGKLKLGDDVLLKKLLTARFENYKNELGIFSVFKNITYSSILGNPINALSNLQDLGMTTAEAPVSTLPEFFKTIFRQNKIKLEDIGIAKSLAEEFNDKGILAKMVRATFKTGFDFADRLGKETLINAIRNKIQKQALKDSDDLVIRLMDTFGNDEKTVKQVINDLKIGYDTYDTKFVLANEIYKKQPVTKLEMPEYYLTHPNMRIAYMMRSYQLKQLDVLRNEVWNVAKTNPIKGFKNLLRISTGLLVSGVAVDELKDFLLGKKVSFKDHVLNNLLKIVGFSRYTFTGFSKTSSISKTILEDYIIPPTNIIDDLYTDISNEFTDFDPKIDFSQWKSIKNIPVFGKLYYYWFGEGAEQTKKYQIKDTPQKIYDNLKNADTSEEKKQILIDSLKSGELNEDNFNKFTSLVKEESLGLTTREQSLKNANLEDRASYIISTVKDINSSDEKKQYLADLEKKGILTKGVLEEMVKIVNNK